MDQLPGYTDRSAASVTQVVCRTEKHEGLGQLILAAVFATEEQDRVAPGLVFDVSPAGG